MLTQPSTHGTPAEHLDKPQNALQAWIHDFKRYREIIVFRTYASLKAETERSYLGYVWWFLEPVVNTFLFYTIFAIFLKHQATDYAVFLIVGFVFWEWFATSVNYSMPSIEAKSTLLQLIYLPKFIFPMCVILSNSWKFICVMGVLLIYLWFRGYLPSIAYTALPLVLLVQFMLIIALSFPLSIIYPLFPDSRIFIQTAMRSLMLVSGIFFEGAKLSPGIAKWFYINPMAHIIEMYRDVLLHHVFPNIFSLLYTFVLAAILMVFSFWLMRHMDRQMPKLLTRD